MGMGLMQVTSPVLVENPEWVRQPDRSQALHSFRSPAPPATGKAQLFTVRQLILVENPEWQRQPDRNQQLFSFRITQGAIVLTVEGSIPTTMGGRWDQPLGASLFSKPPLSTQPPNIVAPLGGTTAPGSVFYATLSLLAAQVGFIPRPGPGLASPYNIGQFVPQAGDTSTSSGSVTPVQAGQLAGTSVFYALLTGSGALSGIFPSGSVFLGSVTSIPIGQMSGVMAAGSAFYANLTGVGALSGETIGGSIITSNQLGGAFIPLVPMTAVTDVRLNIGYQPWKLHPGDVIG